MELSKEMSYTILSDLQGDNQKLQEICNRIMGPGMLSGQVATIDYRDLEMLKYTIKMMEQKVRVLSGSAY